MPSFGQLGLPASARVNVITVCSTHLTSNIVGHENTGRPVLQKTEPSDPQLTNQVHPTTVTKGKDHKCYRFETERKMRIQLINFACCFFCLNYESWAWTTNRRMMTWSRSCNGCEHSALLLGKETEWTSDFDDFLQSGDDDLFQLSSIFKSRAPRDLTAIQTRLFSLGQDLILVDFVGNMGFDEVTDWEYYEVNEEDPSDRRVVQPNPFDSSKPKRTRKSSGSVVRVFRGEFIGRLGGALSSKGLDRRVIVKEFTGEMALQLARYELLSVGKLQSDLMGKDEDVSSGEWIQVASSRSVLARKDDRNVANLVQQLNKAPFLGILGEVNLAELEGEMDSNEFYRALGVPPPKPEAIW